MIPVDDKGKVWLKGAFRPVFAVRVGNKVFVPGCEEGDQVDCWVEAPYLCVDLHHKDRKRRRARRIPLTLPPTRPGTLFNGFTRTPHADVQVVMYTDPGVEEFEVKEESYREKGLEELDGRSFWRRTPFA